MKRMLAAILIVVATTAFSTQEPGERELRITTFTDAGVTILPLGKREGKEPIVLKGPNVSVVLSEDAKVSLSDDLRPNIRADRDTERDWTIFKGHYTIRIEEEGELHTVLKVEAATVVLGTFETPDEGYYR